MLVVRAHGGEAAAVVVEIPVRDSAPIVGEGAVAHEFSIEAAIIGVVDLLRHEPVERGADRVARMVDLDGQRGWIRSLSYGSHGKSHNGSCGGNTREKVHGRGLLLGQTHVRLSEACRLRRSRRAPGANDGFACPCRCERTRCRRSLQSLPDAPCAGPG